MKTSTLLMIATTALLCACGGNYQVTRAGTAASKADFARDEMACNQVNFFVRSAVREDPTQTIHMTDKFIDCMRDKGWNYTRTERTFAWTKSTQLN